MDRIFMDEYYEHLRADNIEAFSKERNDEWLLHRGESEAPRQELQQVAGRQKEALPPGADMHSH
jgi:hypothetical protein